MTISTVSVLSVFYLSYLIIGFRTHNMFQKFPPVLICALSRAPMTYTWALDEQDPSELIQKASSSPLRHYKVLPGPTFWASKLVR